MKIADNELKNMFLCILRNLNGRDDIRREESIVALSEDKTKVAIYTRYRSLDDLPDNCVIFILEHIVGKYKIITTVPISDKVLVNGLDVNNNADKLAIGFITDNEYVKIYSFVGTKITQQTISTNSSNISFGYNVLFNNDNNTLLITAPLDNDRQGNYFLYVLDRFSSYVKVDFVIDQSDNVISYLRHHDFFGHSIKDLEYIDTNIYLHYTFDRNGEVPKMYPLDHTVSEIKN